MDSLPQAVSKVAGAYERISGSDTLEAIHRLPHPDKIRRIAQGNGEARVILILNCRQKDVFR